MASVTFALRSFNRSSIGGTTLSLYLAKTDINPFASPSRQLAATITQLMFASFCMHVASDLANSPNSEASLILGVALIRVKSSSKASFLSFHFEDLRDPCRFDGSLGMISTSSAYIRGSGGASGSTRKLH